jgi:hypothetical protein
MGGEAKLNRQLDDQRKSGCIARPHRGSERNTSPYNWRIAAFGAGKLRFRAGSSTEKDNDEWLAERVGFEPTVEFPQHPLSRRALSTAQTPLRRRKFSERSVIQQS